MSEWSHVSSKFGNVSAAGWAIAHEIWEAAKAAGHDVWFIWGDGPDPDHSFNKQKRPVFDFMVRNEAAGDFVRDYMWANRQRLRLKHVIWEQHITSTVVQPGVRRKMADRGNPTANHMDHPHAEFFPGDYQAPTHSVPQQPPVIQHKLVVNGILDAATIRKWQQVMGTPVDGKIDTDKNGSALVRAVQQRLKSTVDHRLVVDGHGIVQDGKRYKTVGALQRYLGSPVDSYLSTPSQAIKSLQRRLNENRF